MFGRKYEMMSQLSVTLKVALSFLEETRIELLHSQCLDEMVRFDGIFSIVHSFRRSWTTASQIDVSVVSRQSAAMLIEAALNGCSGRLGWSYMQNEVWH